MIRWGWTIVLIAALASCTRPAALEVTDAWSRETVGQSANAAVFMTVRSRTADRLIGASTPLARKTDLMTMEGGSAAMGMKYLDSIDIPANATVRLNPAGLHVWLAGLNRPLQRGQTFALTLVFENAGERRVDVSIIGATSAPPSR